MDSLYPEYSKNVAYMCLEKQNTHKDSGLFISYLDDILELPYLPYDDK